MKRNGRQRKRNERRPFRDIRIDLTLEEVMADLDAGWSAPTVENRKSRSVRRAA